jgi:hypothetical protein
MVSLSRIVALAQDSMAAKDDEHQLHGKKLSFQIETGYIIFFARPYKSYQLPTHQTTSLRFAAPTSTESSGSRGHERPWGCRPGSRS